METQSLLCSLCSVAFATSACICRYPPPAHCPKCYELHQQDSCFHFAFPVCILQYVSSGNFLQWQEWMLALRREQLDLLGNLEAANTLEETVNAAFEGLFSQLQSAKKGIIDSIKVLKTALTDPIQQAVAETTASCGLSAPVFQHSLSQAIWTRACSPSPSQPLFLYTLHTVQEVDISQIVGVSITPLSEFVPKECMVNLPFREMHKEKRDMELGYIQQIEKMKAKKASYLQLLNQKNKAIEDLQNANEMLISQCLQPFPLLVPAIQTPQKCTEGMLNGSEKVAKQCVSCQKLHLNSLNACANYCECEDCIAIHIISEGRNVCLACRKPYFREVAGLFRQIYGVCGHCGVAFRLDKGQLKQHCRGCVRVKEVGEGVEVLYCELCDLQSQIVSATGGKAVV